MEFKKYSFLLTIVVVLVAAYENAQAELINAVPSNFVMTSAIKAQNESSLAINNSNDQLSIDSIINNLQKSMDSLEDYSAVFVWTSKNNSDGRTYFSIKNKKILKEVSEYQGKVISVQSIKILKDRVLKSNWDAQNNEVYRTTIHDLPDPLDFVAHSSPQGMINNFKYHITNKAKYLIDLTSHDDKDLIVVIFDDTINKSPLHKSAVYIRKSDWMLTKYVFDVGNEHGDGYEWKDIKINQRLPDTAFDLEYPKDAKVIEQVFPNRWVGTNNDNETIKPILYRDKNTGILIIVDSDGRHVTAKKFGLVLWRRNPFVQGQMKPYRVTKPVIVSVEKGRRDWHIDIVFNSSQFGEMNLLTGNFEWLGQD